MDEKDLQQEELEFNLDDIMKEFASDPAEVIAVEEESAEEPAKETEVEEESAEKSAEESEVEETLEEPTTELPAVEETTEEDMAAAIGAFGQEEEPVTGDTIRFDTAAVEAAAKASVKGAVPIVEEEPEAAFSGEWEPDYEEPMGTYVPPQPIQFQPRSRLRELKRKIVEGPEKRYYELVELGVAKLHVAIFLSILVVLLSAGSTVMYALDMVQPDRLRLMIFGQALAMLVSALLGAFQLIDGVSDLLKGRFTPRTLLVVTFLACCADAVLCLKEMRVPCCAAFSLEMTLALCSACQKRTAHMGQMDVLRKTSVLYGIAACPDYIDGQKGLLRKDGEVDDFMNNYDQPTTPDKVLSWYALAALAVSVAVGVVAGMFHGLSAGIQVAAVSLLAATPASIFVTTSRPIAILTRRLHSVGAVLCGWQGVEGLCGKAVFPVEYSDLFQPGAARMNGVKFFGNRQPDEIIAYGTAVIVANESGLAPVFTQVLDSRGGYHYDASDLRCYDNGGIGAIVNDEPVLVGSMEFLKEMGVEIPEGIRVHQAVCVAIDGELCGLFALSFENARPAAMGFASLCSTRGLRPVIASYDFLLTESFLRSRFSVKTRRLLLPEHSIRAELQEKVPPEEAPCLALVARNNLAGYAWSIAGARALKAACQLGAIVHILAGALGLAAMVVLTLLGRLDLLTPANMFAYQLVWLIPGLLITEWSRAI